MSHPSYASVAAKDAPPIALQPHPDLALLNTEPPTHDNIADDAAKLNIVAPDFREHPETTTSIQDVPRENPPPVGPRTTHGGRPTPTARARKFAHQAEDEGYYLWNYAKHYILRPSVAGGLLGVVNVGLLSWVGYNLYTKPYLRRDRRLLATGTAIALGLFGAEGYAAEKYRETPAGREEERKAREEGALLYRQAREVILRPGALGGILGLFNVAVLGGVGSLAYLNWDMPRWDRRVVSAISVGLLTLFSGEGYIAEQYRERRH